MFTEPSVKHRHFIISNQDLHAYTFLPCFEVEEFIWITQGLQKTIPREIYYMLY